MLNARGSPGDVVYSVRYNYFRGIYGFFLPFEFMIFGLDIFLKDFDLMMSHIYRHSSSHFYFSNLRVTIIHHFIEEFVNNDKVISGGERLTKRRCVILFT